MAVCTIHVTSDILATFNSLQLRYEIFYTLCALTSYTTPEVLSCPYAEVQQTLQHSTNLLCSVFPIAIGPQLVTTGLSNRFRSSRHLQIRTDSGRESYIYVSKNRRKQVSQLKRTRPRHDCSCADNKI